MVFTNAERQKRFRERRNRLARAAAATPNIVDFSSRLAMRDSGRELDEVLALASHALDAARTLDLTNLDGDSLVQIVSLMREAQITIASRSDKCRKIIEARCAESDGIIAPDEVLKIIQDAEPRAFVVRLA